MDIDTGYYHKKPEWSGRTTLEFVWGSKTKSGCIIPIETMLECTSIGMMLPFWKNDVVRTFILIEREETKHGLKMKWELVP